MAAKEHWLTCRQRKSEKSKSVHETKETKGDTLPYM